ncbi:MAG: RNA methyltransferase [Anaerolineaceae bacterium]|nr:RNA methyltransferase [Anaerolineaceae bacterium]
MAEFISSPNNPKIKMARALQTHPRGKQSDQAFIAEGVRLVEEAASVGWPVEFILFDESLSERGQVLIQELIARGNTEVYQIPPNLMSEISGTETPQGILAVLKNQALPLPTDPTFLILADQVRDPGNMGTLLRTAEAAGADGVILTPGTVNAFAPKVLRAGMGAHFHLPIHALPWQEITPLLKGLPVFLATADASLPLWEADFTQPCVLLLGGEAFGATSMGEALATDRVAIPMPGRAESLNAAMAGGILIAEVLRQRYSKKAA